MIRVSAKIHEPHGAVTSDGVSGSIVSVCQPVTSIDSATRDALRHGLLRAELLSDAVVVARSGPAYEAAPNEWWFDFPRGVTCHGQHAWIRYVLVDGDSATVVPFYTSAESV